MKYYSTGRNSPLVTAREAVLAGLAPDGGLYMPEYIPKFSGKWLSTNQYLTFQEIALETALPYFSDDIPYSFLQELIEDAFDFELPIVEISDGVFSFELFHGPTLAFKDFAARFMSRLMGYYIRESDEKITILVATSGDTGGAVAHGFLGVSGIDVVILYPKGKVSPLQEKQLTTLGQNIDALEIEGTFDDCQALVKQAFNDKEVKQYRALGSANSINIARLIPQSFYYVYLASRMQKLKVGLNVSIPSGNLGNLSAGIIAKQMGAGIDKFIISTNINDTIPRYVKTGNYIPMKSRQTLSNAMDVGDPSNFVRMYELVGARTDELKKFIEAYSFTDHETKQAIHEVYDKYNYILDPHGAIGWLGIMQSMRTNKHVAQVLVETAHPAKFQESMKEILGMEIDIPKRLSVLKEKDKKAIELANNYEEFKAYLLS